MNKVILMGRLTRDVEMRQTPNGVSLARFSIAVNRRFAGKDAQQQADFINCVAWRQTAEFISRYFSKGKMIALEGSIQVRNYTNKNDNKRQAVEVLVSQAYFAGDNSQKQGPAADTKNYPPITYSSGAPEDFTEVPEEEGDLPF